MLRKLIFMSVIISSTADSQRNNLMKMALSGCHAWWIRYDGELTR